MALGADLAGVLRMVIRPRASLATAGIAAGLGGAFALTRLLKTMLFGVGVNDAPAFAEAPLALVFVVLLATLIPARRATRVSPVTAMRYQ